MFIIPCVNCGGKPHKNLIECPANNITSKPKKWNTLFDVLAKVPVSGSLGTFFRLKMLQSWSELDKSSKPAKISSNPRDFSKINVNSLQAGDVFSWCQWLGISFDDEMNARKKLLFRFKKLDRTVDVYSGFVKNEHPYRCSKYPNDPKMALLHTKDVDVDWDNVFDMIGQSCPDSSCNGKIVANVQEYQQA